MIVVKVGGSLFDWPGLGPALRAFVATLAPEPVLLVPGGGHFADVVRKLHPVHGLTEEQSHEIALVSLAGGMSLLRNLVPGAQYIANPLEGDALPVMILNHHFFCEVIATDLPRTWEVTTDSIAVRAAVRCKATRLVLLKSVDVPPGTSWDEAAARGWVDPYFPRALAGFAGTVEAVNLRTWRGSSEPGA